MRKLLYTLAGLGAFAMMASCSKEAESPVAESGGLTATFTVLAPDGVVTKAISDGLSAGDFIFAVYDEAGNYLSDLSSHATITGTASPWTVTVPVIKDMTYQFLFLAKSASDGGMYTFDADSAQLDVDYSALTANDDNADFFYVYDRFKIEDSFSKSEYMVRPLAQVNFGASDLAEAAYSIKTDASLLTGVTLTGIYSGMNLLTGSVSGASAEVSFAPAARVQDEDQFVTGYDRIGMVYVLAAESQPNVTATLNVSAEGAANTTVHTITREVANVPLKRNYRTNILGNLFTSDFVFTVQTSPGFYTPEYVEIAGTTIAKANAAFAAGATSSTIDVDPATAGDGVTTITLPATTDDVRVRLNFTTTETITIQYASGAHPANVEIFALSVKEVVANLADTHVTISAGSHITTGTFATSSTTLVLEKTAEVTNLKIKAGNVKLEVGSSVTSIARTEDNEDAKTIVEVEAGLAAYPSLNGSDIEFKKDITGVTIEKTEDTATYSVTSEAIPESALEAIVEDINSDPKENVSIEMAPGTSFEWKTGAGIGSTPIVPSSNTVTKEVVIDGGGSGVFVAPGAGVGDIRAAGDGTLVFRNMVIEDHSVSYVESSWEYGYLEFSGKVRFENCTFNSAIALEDDNDTDENEFTFIDCTFISETEAAPWLPTPSNMYLVWISDGKSTFTNCDFTGYRGVKVHEAYGSEVAEVTVDGCTFHDLSKKPGLALGTLNADTKVSITNCSFVNCQAGDQGLYAYETDTPVTDFDFVFENNTIHIDLSEGVYLDENGAYHVTASEGFAYAVANAPTGTVIKLAAGRYNESAVAHINGGRNLTMQPSVEGSEVVIDGKVFIDGRSVLNVNNLIFNNRSLFMGTLPNTWMDKTGNSNIGLYTGSIHASDCAFIPASDGAGIYVYSWNSGDESSVVNCVFKNTDYADMRPIMAQGDLTVDGCTFDTPGRYCLQLYGAGDNHFTVRFTNNKINPVNNDIVTQDNKPNDTITTAISIGSKKVSVTDFIIDGNTDLNGEEQPFRYVYKVATNYDGTNCSFKDLDGNVLSDPFVLQ